MDNPVKQRGTAPKKRLASNKPGTGPGSGPGPFEGNRRWVSIAWIVGGLLLLLWAVNSLAASSEGVPLSRLLDLVDRPGHRSNDRNGVGDRHLQRR